MRGAEEKLMAPGMENVGIKRISYSKQCAKLKIPSPEIILGIILTMAIYSCLVAYDKDFYSNKGAVYE